ncbi:MAG: hypothetical protein ACE5JP_08860 [Candidatus Bipolaricaulia bacterium]
MIIRIRTLGGVTGRSKAVRTRPRNARRSHPITTANGWPKQWVKSNGKRDQIQVNRRESLINVFEERNTIKILAVFPMYIEKSALKVDVDRNMVRLSVPLRLRQCVELPCAVTGRPKITSKNGIFSIALLKRTTEA